MNRIEKIRAKRVSLDAQERKIADEKLAKILYYKNAIKSLAPKLHEIHELAKECVKCEIPLGKITNLHGSPHYPEFVSEWWYHRPGFVVKKFPKTDDEVYFGVIGGGCAGASLIFDCNGDIIKSPLDDIYDYDRSHADFCEKAERFLNAFSDFVQKFNNYIDTL